MRPAGPARRQQNDFAVEPIASRRIHRRVGRQPGSAAPKPAARCRGRARPLLRAPTGARGDLPSRVIGNNSNSSGRSMTVHCHCFFDAYQISEAFQAVRSFGAGLCAGSTFNSARTKFDMSQIARGLPVVESDGFMMPPSTCSDTVARPAGTDDWMRRSRSQRRKKGPRGFLVAALSLASALNLSAAPAPTLPPLERAQWIWAETNAGTCELRRVFTLASARHLQWFTSIRPLVCCGLSCDKVRAAGERLLACSEEEIDPRNPTH